ncbi:hypothetical protein U1Q18_032735 [Sarracenia purpurea var. burkii]
MHCRKRAPAAAPPPPAQATPFHHAQPLVTKPAQFSARDGRSGWKEKRRIPDRRCCIIAKQSRAVATQITATGVGLDRRPFSLRCVPKKMIRFITSSTVSPPKIGKGALSSVADGFKLRDGAVTDSPLTPNPIYCW